MTETLLCPRNLAFELYEVLDAEALTRRERFADHSRETFDAAIDTARSIAEKYFAPHNRKSDEHEPVYQNGEAVLIPEVKPAVDAFIEAGFHNAQRSFDDGGMQLPNLLSRACFAHFQSANIATSSYPMLSMGASHLIETFGSEEQKRRFLQPMLEGRFFGTMALTEPHAGSSLSDIRTRAEPAGDGSYRLKGNKIFISGGEHDMSENIVHLVLARLPDAPAGVKGISLLLVPKFIANADGTPGARNALSCGAIEHKMGIKGAATCVMNFDGATGWIVGEPNQGLACMFTMMNDARFQVGLQGLGIAEQAYQGSLAYARERLQSRGLTGAQHPDKPADPIIVHPDVRRMLLTMKALNEGGRAFSSYVALQLDIAKFSDDEAARQRAEAQVALLTPVAKAFLTDMGLETTVHGQQVFGGHGFIREWGQEQLVRDCRITQIYEGTNGIQALDLVGRKIVGSGGTMYQAFVDEIRAFVASAGADLREFTEPLKAALDNLDELTAWVIDQAKANPNEIGAASVEYLHVFGYTAYAYMWARMAAVALAKQGEGDFYQSKLGTARFYFARLLPRIHSLTASVKAGSESLYLLDAAQF